MTKYHYSFRNNSDIYSLQLSPQVILGLLKVVFLLLLIIYWKKVYRLIYNFFVYRNKVFTNDNELIEFTSKIEPNFKNAYAINYQEKDRILTLEEVEKELAVTEYEYLIKKSILVKKASELFATYLQDWVNKDFEAIAKYTLRPFSLKQKEIYFPSCGNNFDLIYDCKIFEIKPLRFEVKEELQRFIIQINGEIINFKLDIQGYVVSGQPKYRPFTEYWDIAFGVDYQPYIVYIYQVK